MKTLTIKNLFYISILAISASLNSYSQDGKITVSQDQRFEQLLSKKRKINNSITINDRFKIQIFTGNAELSKKALLDFRKSNKKTDATIVFHTPIYKVWVGNFKTRIEAERKLADLKKKYPNAFLVKPNK